MLGKLIRFEFKSTYKLFLILIGAELLLSIVFGISVNTNIQMMSEKIQDITLNSTGTLSTFSFVLAMMVVGIVVATFMMIFGSSVQRFHKNLLSGQGYLMHTLPVSTWQLVLSKVITYLIYVVLFVIAQLICFVAAVFAAGLFSELMRSINFNKLINELWSKLDVRFFEICLIWLFSASQFLLLVYLCYAVGNLFPEHRLLVGIATFIVVGIVVPSLLHHPSIFTVTFSTLQFETRFNYGLSYETMTLIYSLIMNGILFAINVYILRYHLNLE